MGVEETTEQAVRAASRMYLAHRPQVALGYLEEALAVDSLCYEALVMTGELYHRWGPELGLTEEEGDLLALSFFDRAIAAQPEDAEAYAEKALSLFYLERDAECIQCADRGLALLDLHPTLDKPPGVWTNIGESLYRRKALALMESGRGAEARQVLGEGLSRFPGSEYLTQAVEKLLPEL